MATNTAISKPISVHPDLAEIAHNNNEDVDVTVARRIALRAKIAAEGVNRPIYVWPHEGQHYVLEGIDVFTIATDLGLKSGVDYPLVIIELPSLESAKRWRFERVATTQREISDLARCMGTLKLYKDDIAAYKHNAKKNQVKGGKGEAVQSADKCDLLAFLAAKAGVSRTTMARAKVIFDEANRDPHAENPNKRPHISSEDLLAIIDDVESGKRSLKNGAADVKAARERAVRQKKNSSGAKEASADFVCDSDFDPNKPSQIICGDSLELMERWADLPQLQRPQPSVIFGSPPYWIEENKDNKKNAGKGNLNYGEHFRAMMERRGIKTFDDYVEKLLRPYITAAYALLPRGGRLIFQIDNTRGRDRDGNLVVFFHTDAIRRIGRELGFIPSAEIIWSKLEISGKKQGFGSRNSPSIRPNHEYIVVLRKDCNEIKGDFEFIGSEMAKSAISVWNEKPIEEWSEREKTLYTSDIWEIGAAQNNIHPGIFPRQLADQIIRLFAPLDSVVLDPWNGVGTTSAMATLCDRRFIGIDIEPYFCEIATQKVAAAVKTLPKIIKENEERLGRRVA